MLPNIAITPGEPAGIGPDITLKLLQQQNIAANFIVFADPDLLQQRAEQLGLSIKLDNVVPIPLSQPVIPGELNSANANYVIETLTQACQACLNKQCDALVTAPVHKGIINDAGINFTGHTEFLADLSNVKQVVMMLATPKLRVALVTTHLPLSQISSAITATRLETVIRILNNHLQQKFGLKHPKILVCGLNPHAGEDGHLGNEEIITIIPTLNKLRDQGINLIGPVSADTAFTTNSLSGIDVVLTMYHDQGLPVLKSQGFGEAVNVTLGLPIIRTSVDHGTALNLAATGKASSTSLHYAVQIALEQISTKFI
jgi:4-hydroxythreonine-4-phosphate dehydrogenase